MSDADYKPNWLCSALLQDEMTCFEKMLLIITVIFFWHLCVLGG